MIKLDSILKSRDITLPIKIHIVKSEVAQSCLILCNPIDCSLSGSSVHGIFQAKVLEWVAISFSRGSSWPRDRTQVSHIVDRCFTIWATREVPTHNSGVSLKTWKIPCRHFHFPGAHLEVLKKITNSFPRWFHDFVLLPTSMRVSAASHFHQWWEVFDLLNFIYSNVWETVSHCSFHFHFPDS